MGTKLLLLTRGCRILYTDLRLLMKSVTLDDLECSAVILRYFTEFSSLWAITSQWLKSDSYENVLEDHNPV